MDYPSNSKYPRKEGGEDRKVEQVVTGEAVAQKKGLGRKFKDVFFGGDSRNALQVVLSEVVVPQIKDMLAEAATTGFEKLIFGESRGPRRPSSRPGSPSPHTNYNRYSAGTGRPNTGGRPAPVVNLHARDVSDIVLGTRIEAETVLDRMHELLERYGSVTLTDLYTLIGWTSTYVDGKWGWTDLGQASSRVSRGGWVLSFPPTQALD